MALRERELPPSDPVAPPVSGTAPPTPVCWALMGVCGVAFAANLALGGQPFRQMVLFGPKVLQGEWWRVLTCVFAHGSIMHIVFNLSAVWTLGRMLEAGIGRFFATIVHAARKPAPDGILRALDQLRVEPGRALHVGDDGADEEAAGAAGTRFDA